MSEYSSGRTQVLPARIPAGSGPDLYAIQEKIRRGAPLTPAQQAFVMKCADEKGRVNRRRFIGLNDYPNSVIDFDEA